MDGGEVIPMTKLTLILAAMVAAATLIAASSRKPEPARGTATSNTAQAKSQEKGFWPDQAASKVVSLSKTGPSNSIILIQTHAVAVKETGSKETVAKFGEVYAWSPSFIAVHQNEPTRIRFWNLQPDDEHDFMLVGPKSEVLMKLPLVPLADESYVFTFHEQGQYTFICSVHTPEMVGQILVLPPARR
jgi:plastocyanin